MMTIDALVIAGKPKSPQIPNNVSGNPPATNPKTKYSPKLPSLSKILSQEPPSITE